MKFEIKKVEGWAEAIYGMRLSFQSQDKMDSMQAGWFVEEPYRKFTDVIIGQKDMFLMKRLIAKHPSERKFLRSIIVWAEVEMPIDWWSEFDTYHVGTNNIDNRLSGSTMHTLKKEIRKPEFTFRFTKNVKPIILDTLKEMLEQNCSITELKDNLPGGFILNSIVSFSYETAINIYMQRFNHKLEHWEVACGAILNLPYFKEFLLIQKDKVVN